MLYTAERRNDFIKDLVRYNELNPQFTANLMTDNITIGIN